MESSDQASLYIVSTPIGNLGDITYRAVETLRQADLVVAEDTRRTRILLNHFEIRSRLSSFNSFNQDKKTSQFIEMMKQGKTLALVSDAGTPGISDPLYQLVTAAIAEEIPVWPIPGASAVLSALTVSGLPMDRFIYEGFLPRKKRRQSRLADLAEQNRTVVLYESPQRIQKTLVEILAVFGNRQVAVARELTKLHEEVIRGNLEDVISRMQDKTWRGEITLVISSQAYKLAGDRKPEAG